MFKLTSEFALKLQIWDNMFLYLIWNQWDPFYLKQKEDSVLFQNCVLKPVKQHLNHRGILKLYYDIFNILYMYMHVLIGLHMISVLQMVSVVFQRLVSLTIASERETKWCSMAGRSWGRSVPYHMLDILPTTLIKAHRLPWNLLSMFVLPRR